MARYTDAVCRLCRREGIKLFLKGTKCFSDKCPIEKRNFAPGQHGKDKKTKTKIVGYGLQLREKQKAKRMFFVQEGQFRNYFENKPHFLGIGNYTAEGFAQMEKAVPKALAIFRLAIATPKLKVVFGTDAVAGSHGRNFQELEYRVQQGGQRAIDAITSATSLAAESLGLGDRLGSIRPGYEADLIAVDGNPLTDSTALEHVAFVMKSGVIVKEPR